jgi:hypothetical protein
MPTTLSALIEDVKVTSPSPAPLDLLATAASNASEMNDLTDAMLSYFVDRCRFAGHSWAEIGVALGVTKQAVQKRFNRAEMPPMWERVTPRARRVVELHAPAAAVELGHNFVGTEHILLGLYDEAGGIAAKILVEFGVTRDQVVAAIKEQAPPSPDADGGTPFTPKAWVALTNSATEALKLGHNYVGTEHYLLSLLSAASVGGLAAEVLQTAGVTYEATMARVVQMLSGYMQKP